MFQHGANLLDSDSREPFNELGHQGAVLEVLKERCDLHSRPAKHPGATHALRVAFNGRTGRPINHVLDGTTGTLEELPSTLSTMIGPRDFDGLRIPTRRRVYPLLAGSEPIRFPTLVAIDIHHLRAVTRG